MFRLTLLLLWLAPALLYAQTWPEPSSLFRQEASPPTTRRSTPRQPATNPLEQLRKQFQVTETSTALQLEGPVQPEEYLVGPGDLFMVSIGGGTPVQVPAMVMADGRILLPAGEALSVADRSLAEVTETLEQKLRQHYRHVPVAVTLAQPRQFSVHVTGSVPTPGRLPATATTRLETLLNAVFSPETGQEMPAAPPVSDRFEPDLRNIQILRRDGTTLRVDLVRYYATGDRTCNPYLRDGDRIHIPAYLPGRQAVFVDGRIPFAGVYPYRPDDTVGALVDIATGGQSGVFSHVRLLRSNSPLDTLLDLEDPSAATFPLQAGDHLYLMTREPRGLVTLEGRVRYPGTYPIVPGQTTLRELIQQAGGLLPDALQRGAYIERRHPVVQPALLSNGTYRPAPPLPDTLTSRYLQGLEGDFFTRAYLAEQLRTAAFRVAVNLTEVLQGGADLPLHDGDRVVIPRDEKTVLVLGRVVRPGFVPYTPGKTAAYYLEAAGGRAPGAETVYVRDASTGKWHTGLRREIHSGDVIFVRWDQTADQAELQRLLLQRQDVRIRTVQTALTAVGAVSTIITTYLLVRDRLK